MPPQARAGSPWILNAPRDLLLFIATPLLLIPLVAIGSRAWGANALYPIAAFGALGHHLPGMIRAYGDRELFARFRTRFVAAPLFLVGVCVASAFLDPTLSAIVLVTYLWGVWHGLMQTHGFLRIYDAKRGATDRLTARLDHAMCLVWFAGALLFSTKATHHVLQEFYMAGGPFVSVGALATARMVWGVVVASVTAAWLVHLVQSVRAGRAPNPIKPLLLATSVAYWWYANTIVGNLILGVLLFELFHDVQYLAITWVYNRRRVASGSHVDRFTRFVFRDRAPLMLLYVGLVAAYGGLRFVPELPSATLQRVFLAVLAASALLHFYYDSFIWKVKERTTRAGLGLAGGAAEPALPRQRAVAWAVPALRWSLLVVPLVALAFAFDRSGDSAIGKMIVLGRDFPDYAPAQHNLAVALAAEGRFAAAIDVETRAVTLALQRDDRDLAAEARRNIEHFRAEIARQNPDRTQAAPNAVDAAAARNPGMR